MKKLIVLGMAVGIAMSAGAGEKGTQDETLTKEAYVARQLKWAQKDSNWNPSKAELEALFDRLDTDGDGTLSLTEKETKTKSKYVNKRLQWAKENPDWKPSKAKLEAKFDALDKDGDGLLTAEEAKAEK